MNEIGCPYRESCPIYQDQISQRAPGFSLTIDNKKTPDFCDRAQTEKALTMCPAIQVIIIDGIERAYFDPNSKESARV